MLGRPFYDVERLISCLSDVSFTGRVARGYSASGLLVDFRVHSADLSVGNEPALWKNGRLDRAAVWNGDRGGRKEACVRWA